MSSELNSADGKSKTNQTENGGFVWFKGSPDDRYITQYIVKGRASKKIKTIPNDQGEKLKVILNFCYSISRRKIKQDYDNLIKIKQI